MSAGREREETKEREKRKEKTPDLEN